MTARIALDAMGGDHAPKEVVAGALSAADLNVQIILVGRGDAIRAELAGKPLPSNITIVECSEVIEMDDHPTEAVRNKPDSSINVGIKLVKDGQADAFVTAGNTGASMAAALLTLGRIKGIGRPALGTVFPTGDGVSLFLDVGANADCRPIHLVQFAHMGAAYMQRVLRIPNPRVGLISIGEEDTKGNALTIEVHQSLRASSLNFVGNIEGKDLTKGLADVVVMDGFTGNVVLKTAEGMAEMIIGELRAAIAAKPWNKLAGLLLLPDLRKVKRRLDYSEYGGAQLLGVDGVTVIGHGRSNARAIYSALRAARDAVDGHVIETIREVAREIPAKKGASSAESDD